MLNDNSLRKILIKTYKLTPAEERLYFTIREIYFFWGRERCCYASNEALIEETNMSSGTVRRALKVLEEKKLITLAYEKTKGFLSKRNIYPREDELLKADAQTILDERISLTKSRNEIHHDHNDDQYDQRTMINMPNYDDQYDHINNINLNNNNLNNIIDIPEDQFGATAPVNASVDPLLDAKEKWNSIAKRYNLQTVNVLTKTRIQHLKARIKEAGGDDAFWAAVEKAIAGSPFLRGQNDRKWRANFDFFMRQSSFVKALEGSYAKGSLMEPPKKPIDADGKKSDEFVKLFFNM